MKLEDFIKSFPVNSSFGKERDEKELLAYLKMGIPIAFNPVFKESVEKQVHGLIFNIFKALEKNVFDDAKSFAAAALALISLYEGFLDMKKQVEEMEKTASEDKGKNHKQNNSVSSDGGEDPYRIR